MQLQHCRHGQVTCLSPCRHAHPQTRPINPYPRVDARHVHVDPQFWRTNGQLRPFDLQLAEAFQALEWINLRLPGQANDFPATVCVLHQCQQQVAYLQFRQRVPGQQARIHGDLQLRPTDGQFGLTLAHVQVFQDEARSAPGPLTMGFGKTYRLADAGAQPGGNPLRVPLDHGQ